jgi:two-component system nitrogen regulation response regulator GlnG
VKACQILVIDDEQLICALFASILRSAFPAATVRAFPSAEAALEHIQQEEADILITDHSMVDMTGADLACRIRETHPLMPIVMVSDSPYAEAAATRAGVNVFISKREGVDRLPSIVAELLNG